MRRVLTFLACVVVVAPSLAMAHGRMMVPLNRSKAADGANNNLDQNGGLTTGPCGGVAKPAASTNSYPAGSQLSMTIETTIPHSSSVSTMEEYDFYWSPANDTGLFTGTAGPTAIKKVMFAKPASAQTNAATLVLPATPATNGTLQMVMINDDAAPPTIYYYSCVDLTLTAAVDDDGGETMDLSMAGGDASAAVDAGPMDLTAVAPVDMQKRPAAEKATLPGCSMTPGSSPASESVAMFGFLLLAFVLRRSVARRA